MSIGLFIKQKKFIQSELKKGNKDYEEIYRKAKKKQFKKEKRERRIKKTIATFLKHGDGMFKVFWK